MKRLSAGWRGRVPRTLASALVALGASGCASGPSCPAYTPQAWAAELGAKAILPLDARRDVSIKRDVHQVYVSLSAAELASAFQRVMQDSSRRYGLIRVDRLPENVGRPFQLGERFQGRYSIEQAVQQRLRPRLRRAFAELARDAAIEQLFCRIENQQTSDYGIISRLDLNPSSGGSYVLQYRYLQGSPIAGSSTFVIDTVSDPALLARWGVPSASRLEQVFEYQELTHSVVLFFGTLGLALHNQVVFSQVHQAAELGGGRILATDIPREYQKL